MKKRLIVSKILIAVGIILVLGALFLFLKNEYDSSQAGKIQDESMTVLRQKIESGVEPSNAASQNGDETSSDIPSIEINGEKYMGYLYFPSLSKEFSVMSSWSYPKLKKSVCRYYGSVYTNDLVIAGHNYRKHFGQLKKLNVGDKVYFISSNGVSYEYEVGEIEIVSPTDISRMIESQYDLTLFTCTYGGQDRYTVRCKKVNSN